MNLIIDHSNLYIAFAILQLKYKKNPLYGSFDIIILH